LSIRSFSDLTVVSFGEGNAEHSQDITILGLDFAIGLDQCLPFSDILAQLVSGDIHTIEAGSAISTIDVFNPKLDFSPRKRKRRKKKGLRKV